MTWCLKNSLVRDQTLETKLAGAFDACDLHGTRVYMFVLFCSRRMAPAGAPSSNGVLPPPSVMAGSSLASYKRTWCRGVAPCLAFLGAFSIAMALLLVWSEAAALRWHSFDLIFNHRVVWKLSVFLDKRKNTNPPCDFEITLVYEK